MQTSEHGETSFFRHNGGTSPSRLLATDFGTPDWARLTPSAYDTLAQHADNASKSSRLSIGQEHNPFEASFAKTDDRRSSLDLPSYTHFDEFMNYNNKRTLSPSAQPSAIELVKRPRLSASKHESETTTNHSSILSPIFDGLQSRASDSPESSANHRTPIADDLELNKSTPSAGQQNEEMLLKEPQKPTLPALRPYLGNTCSYSSMPPALQASMTEAQSIMAYAEYMQSYEPSNGLVQTVPAPLPPSALTKLSTSTSMPTGLSEVMPSAISFEDEPAREEATPEPMPTAKGKGKAKSKPQAKKPAATRKSKKQDPVMTFDEAGEDGNDEDKRKQFLERNRLAACKSRQKKKEWVNNLESHAADLTKENGELQKVIETLREELTNLRSQLAAHAGCQCSAQPTASAQVPLSATVELLAPGASRIALPPIDLALEAAGQLSVLQPEKSARLNSRAMSFSFKNGEDIPLPPPPRPSSAPASTPGTIEVASQDYFSRSAMLGNSLPLTTPDLVRQLGFGH